MPLTLGMNISSMAAMRQLDNSNRELGNVFQRLSSGLRISSASDDAAGLALADSLRSDRTVYARGVKNLNDGISALNVADSAIGELINIVSRIEELANQAANGSLDHTQREALDIEAQALSAEFSRIRSAAEFNGKKLFDGTLQDGLKLQTGYGTSGSILGFIGGGLADGTFNSTASNTYAANTSKLLSADLNGDGNLDIITTNSTNVSISLGNGDGTFATPTTFVGGGTTIEGLAVEDFNGDGLLDIASAAGTTLSIFTGNGDGTFSAAGSQVAGVLLSDIVAGDFNGDGSIDLGINDYSNGNVVILEGSGNGTFSNIGTYAVGRSYDMEVGDFTGDGLLDITVLDYTSGEMDILIGDGSGGFSATTLFTGILARSSELGDFDGDGDLDLAVGNIGIPSVDIYLNNGSGSFSNTQSITGLLNQMHDLKAGDFNGDGVLDLVTGNYDDNSLSIFLGDGDGNFTLQTASLTASDAVFELALGDFNNDGVQDIFSSGNAGFSDVHLGNSIDGINPILPFSLRTQAAARQALKPLENKREALLVQRGEIGAFLSRASSAREVVEAVGGGYQSAESRIRDIDMATEVTRLTRYQILENSATAILAQANQQAELVLRLLD